ncbi:Hypothetical protein Rta_04270 [Ramlibacter tataouinensis TTB310]|uniref:Uncharacterized protein n=2 Tax=Ramlibacter tataouinensis TaxID=94132 RepID=F5Y5Z4_RAMTT|nr:Hypothetical protein Rta_04270 [Ramlibacter tataouinensis TTB310]
MAMARRTLPAMAPSTAQFTPEELKLLLDALLDARLVLSAIDGGTLQPPFEEPQIKLELGDEINRLEAALMLVATS